MNLNASGLSSGIQNATYQSNRTDAQKINQQIDLTFLATDPSKGQLRKHYELQAMEIAKLKRDSKSREMELLEELREANKRAAEYHELYVNLLHERNVKDLHELDLNYLKVAG